MECVFLPFIDSPHSSAADLLILFQDAQLSGTLNLVFSGFTATAGTTWNIFSYTIGYCEIWGQFSSVTFSGTK